MDPIYERLPRAEPDELVAPEVGEWSRQKHLKLWNYLGIFTTGMKNQHDRRVYIDLFAGAGKARVRGTGDWLLGSPLLALSVRDPFDLCIFCEKDRDKADALAVRARRYPHGEQVHVLTIDANEDIAPIEALIPGGRTLTFCFVDPYDIAVNFSNIERLTRNRRMDVLILLAVQMDARRNLSTYLRDDNQKIARLLGRRDWQMEWRQAEADGMPFGRWLTLAFTSSMQRIGYVAPRDADIQSVTLKDSGSHGLYYLAFYSKHPRGYDFWRKAVTYASAQIAMPFDL
jgi:three-Cys-motif partner protein